MKILEVKPLVIPDVKVIKFQRFKDERGYFTEVWRKTEFEDSPSTSFLKSVQWGQANESYSIKGVVRGLHFQWNPYMGKLVRTIRGRMIDLVLDIRKGSPTFGKIIGYDMPSIVESNYGEWIWVPIGFAHGNVFPVETLIEYYCTSQWAPKTETGISPFSPDIDWGMFDQDLKRQIDEIISNSPLISPKDKAGFTIEQWSKEARSDNFVYGKS